MGEVYRARDTKLGRDVALKILPDSFVHDPDRVARFRREAQVVASLNHPNIAAIYGLEEEAGSQFLVLELDRLSHSRCSAICACAAVQENGCRRGAPSFLFPELISFGASRLFSR